MPSFQQQLDQAFQVEEIRQSFRGEVVKVHDGDTITIKHPDIDKPFPVRLAKINAPELSHGGKETGDWLRDIILGEEVEIIIDINNLRGKYGRLLGEVVHIGINLGDAMVRLGLAVQYGDKGYFIDIDSDLNDKLYKNLEGTNF